MSDPTLLRANVAAISPLITDPDTNPFLPQPPHACSDFLRDVRIVQPSQGSSHADGTIRFEFSKSASTLFRLYLRCRRPATAIPGGGATFLRWVDWVAVTEIQEIKVEYFGNPIYRYTNDYLMRRIKNTFEPNKLKAYQNNCLGDKDEAFRSQATQLGFTTFLPIMLPCSFDVSQSMPIIALSQKLYLNIELKALTSVLNCDDATYVPSIATQFDIFADYYVLTEPENAFLTSKAGTEDGIAYLNSNKVIVQHQNITVDNTITTSFDVDTRLLTKGTVKEFEFTLTPLQLRSTPFGNDWWVTGNNPVPLPSPAGPVAMGAYAEILAWTIQCSGTDVVRRNIMSNGGIQWNKNLYYKDYHTGEPGENRYGWSFSLAPEMENAALGNLAFANLDTPTLTLTFAPNGTLGLPGGTGINPLTAAAQYLDLTMLYYTYSYVQWQGGDLTEVFV